VFLEKINIMIIYEANKYLERIPSSVKIYGSNKLFEMIKSTSSTNQQRDFLMSFILASLYGDKVSKIVFEEECSKHLSKGAHDLVVYLPSGNRIINEIRRLKQTSWDKYEEDNFIFGSSKKTDLLYELREDPNRSTTGFFDTILNEIEAKSNQLDPGEINIIWIASKSWHYKATFIEDAASYYSVNSHEKLINQTENIHIIPKSLSALGWFWDGDPYNTTANAECFFITPSKIIDEFKNIFMVNTFYNIR
jgi:hypothetical protein